MQRVPLPPPGLGPPPDLVLDPAPGGVHQLDRRLVQGAGHVESGERLWRWRVLVTVRGPPRGTAPPLEGDPISQGDTRGSLAGLLALKRLIIHSSGRKQKSRWSACLRACERNKSIARTGARFGLVTSLAPVTLPIRQFEIDSKTTFERMIEE